MGEHARAVVCFDESRWVGENIWKRGVTSKSTWDVNRFAFAFPREGEGGGGKADSTVSFLANEFLILVSN